jgi:KaiC/GvpD/RAD55 family RecA-like ATPase
MTNQTMNSNKEDLNALKRNPAVLRVYSSKTKLEKKGKEWCGLCPFHSEKSSSFTISQANNGNYVYHCFGCAASGSIIDFVQNTEGISFKEAVSRIKESLGDNWKESAQAVDRVFKPVQETKEYKTFTLAQYAKLEQNLTERPDIQGWLLKERGITYDTAKKLHFGFRQKLGEICAVQNRDCDDGGWLAMPCIENGIITSLEYRACSAKKFNRQPKMKTSLSGLDDIDILEPVFVCEGKFDRAILVQAGFKAVSLANSTTILTPEQRDQILQASQVILAGDDDGGAGVKAMDRLQVDFQDKAVRIHWPDGCKDANDAFLTYCDRDVDKFRELVNRLVSKTTEQPVPGVYSLLDTLRYSEQESLLDHPDRFRFPWKSVDDMAILLPGSVVFSTATSTGTGKTILWHNATLHAARKNREVVLNYQCELGAEEMAVITVAHLLAKDRNEITKDDRRKAVDILSGIRYYIGSDPTLTSFTQVLDLIEMAVRRLGITVVVLDHLHFICSGETNEILAQSQAMQRIKNMAKIYGLKFIVIGQPRKADQKSKGKRLHISDAKGSGGIPDAADAVYFMHREVVKNIDPANPPMDEYEPETEISLKKGRSHGRGAVFTKLYYHGAIATFAEMTQATDYDTMLQEG